MVEWLKLVRRTSDAKAVIFYSFGEGLGGGQCYDSHTIENVGNQQTLLAYEMNFKPLGEVYGAPLRLRVENQLGFKMVKWITAIEFVQTHKHVRKGEEGYSSTTSFSIPWPIFERKLAASVATLTAPAWRKAAEDL